jgi:type I restriction enzyme M protein
VNTAELLKKAVGGEVFTDYNVFYQAVEKTLEKSDRKLSSSDLKIILSFFSMRDESCPPVVSKIHKPGKVKADPLYGMYEAKIDGKICVVEYETDSELRDTEQVPLLEVGGIEAFFEREVLPYIPDAWIKKGSEKIGYEVSFTRHFYKPMPLRNIEEIRRDILTVEKESGGLLSNLLTGSAT